MPEEVPTSPSSDDFQVEVPWSFVIVDGRARETHGSKRPAQFKVCVMLASIEKRVRCVGVEVRSYERTDDKHGGVKPLPPNSHFTEIGSALWRSIPIGDLIERSIARSKDHYKALVDMARKGLILKGWEDIDMARALDVLGEVLGDDEPARPRRGPQRLLSLDDLTTVIAPAYLTGGRKPVVAVRDALSKHRGEPVTMDQARKAVVRARAAGALPPAHGRGKP